MKEEILKLFKVERFYLYGASMEELIFFTGAKQENLLPILSDLKEEGKLFLAYLCPCEYGDKYPVWHIVK